MWKYLGQSCLQLTLKWFAAAAKSRQSCPTLCDPRDGSPPGSPSLRFSRQEHWSGLPFPSPMHEVAQSCLTLRDPMDCSLPGSSIHGIFQARVLEWGAIAFSINLILTWYSGLYIQIWSHISGKFLFYLKSYFKSMSHWPQEVSLMFPDVTLNDSHFLAVGTAQQSCCATFLPNCIFSHVT